jgi:hypothetical protein
MGTVLDASRLTKRPRPPKKEIKFLSYFHQSPAMWSKYWPRGVSTVQIIDVFLCLSRPFQPSAPWCVSENHATSSRMARESPATTSFLPVATTTRTTTTLPCTTPLAVLQWHCMSLKRHLAVVLTYHCQAPSRSNNDLHLWTRYETTMGFVMRFVISLVCVGVHVNQATCVVSHAQKITFRQSHSTYWSIDCLKCTNNPHAARSCNTLLSYYDVNNNQVLVVVAYHFTRLVYYNYRCCCCCCCCCW